MLRQFNFLEACFWISLGVAFLLAACSKKRRRSPVITSFVFVAFGISDLVEIQTGAWWRPWWLLAWKTVCVAMLVGLYAQYVQRRRHNREQAKQLDQPEGSNS